MYIYIQNMMVVGLKAKKFCTGQDEITYWTLTFKVKVTVTSFVYATLRHSLIYITGTYKE